MAFTLDQVVPWGRLYDEYRRMFALTDDDLRSRVLGCGDGPAGFNAGATRWGSGVVSCDPLYRFTADEIRSRVSETYDQMIEQTRLNQAEFVWDTISSIEELGRIRMQALSEFLADYEQGREQGRYVEAALPALPFADLSFDLALCSHFLFLYTEHLTESFHLESVLEMCRVAREVRIFPLLALGAGPSRYVDSVTESLRRAGFVVSIEVVPYEFKRGANQMMRIRRNPPADRS
ncbi:MAG TPA: SAM-dependent methyltransferase [Blastocatellia bacterium]|nr:SAM-dependent methyltransferase [Blastocatellia bacterium]